MSDDIAHYVSMDVYTANFLFHIYTLPLLVVGGCSLVVLVSFPIRARSSGLLIR